MFHLVQFILLSVGFFPFSNIFMLSDNNYQVQNNNSMHYYSIHTDYANR